MKALPTPVSASGDYVATEYAQSLDSFEGVPEWPQARETRREKSARASWQNALHGGLEWFGTISPGLILAGILAWAGTLLAEWLGRSILHFERSPISPILVTVFLGLLIRNVAGLPAVFERGLSLCMKRVLRIGIALLGLELSLAAVGHIGITAVPIVAGCVLAALLLVTWIGRMVGLPGRLGTLIAVGTSICGVTAVVATGPVIEAEEEEVGYAVACVTLFGMAALFLYPFLAHWLFASNPEQVGLFLGTAIHDTSQVAGAGLLYQQYYGVHQVLSVATTTKLVRNVAMGAVIPLMAILWHRKQTGKDGAKRAKRLKWHRWIPPFVIAFVALAALRSVGDLGSRPLGALTRAGWQSSLATAHNLSLLCLATAMASVGLGTSLAHLKNLGWKPLCVGFTAALLVGAVSVTLVKLVATMV